MKRFPRWTIILSRILLTCGVAATLVGAFYVEEDLRGDYAWRRFTAERANAGTPLDFEYYRPASVPDSENLFKSATLEETAKEIRDRIGPWQSIQRNNHEISAFWKAAGQWHKGTRTDYRKVFSILRKQQDASGDYPGEKKTAQLLINFIAPVAPQLDQLVKDARSRKWSIADYPGGGQQPYLYQECRLLSVVLEWRESAEIVLGDSEASFQDVHTTLRLVEGIQQEPLPFRLLYAGSMGYFSLEPVWEGCFRHIWDEHQLSSIQVQLSEFRPLHLLPKAICANTAIMQPGPQVLPRWMPEGWAKLCLIDYAENTAAGELRSFDAEAGHVNLGDLKRFQAKMADLQHNYSPYRQLSKHFWFPHLVQNIAMQQCGYILAETACALERMRLATGSYPISLGELVPRYMNSIPTDVADGAPLRYHADADGRYTLYSIGLNGVDDRGQISDSKTGTFFSWSTQDGDWVWPKPNET